MIVDLLTDQLTVPTPSGKQYPVVMEAGATRALMFVASNPGCTVGEIRDALDISPVAFQARIERLRERGLVVGNRRYQINFARASCGRAGAFPVHPWRRVWDTAEVERACVEGNKDK